MKIAVTGHRPNKLWGYDYKHPNYKTLCETFKQLLIENNCTEAITGMALGVDQVFAMAVIGLKKAGHSIKLYCAIPCQNHSSKWPSESVRIYNTILKYSDNTVLVNDKPYTPQLMQLRNEYMVDLADKVIAVWDGSKSGTGNCVAYAKHKHKPIILVDPTSIK